MKYLLEYYETISSASLDDIRGMLNDAKTRYEPCGGITFDPENGEYSVLLVKLDKNAKFR